jgi:hypothetical protein
MNAAGRFSDLPRHELNNLLGKILGAAELAMDQPCGEPLRRELETIIALAEEGARIVARAPHNGPSDSCR